MGAPNFSFIRQEEADTQNEQKVETGFNFWE